MRRLFIALSLLVAVQVSATSCITVIHNGLDFFANAEAVFFARAEIGFDGICVFRADEVLRGAWNVGDAVSFRPRECEVVRDGERYLIARRRCALPSTAEPCFSFADQGQTEKLLHYLANVHPETHETIMAAFLRWYRHEGVLPDFAEWLDTAAVRPRAELDDQFAYALIEELRSMFSELRLFATHKDIEAFARDQLQAVAPLMEAFPAGLAEEFDVRMARALGDDAPMRDELEEAVCDALSAATESDAWRNMRAEVFEKPEQ